MFGANLRYDVAHTKESRSSLAEIQAAIDMNEPEQRRRDLQQLFDAYKSYLPTRDYTPEAEELAHLNLNWDAKPATMIRQFINVLNTTDTVAQNTAWELACGAWNICQSRAARAVAGSYQGAPAAVMYKSAVVDPSTTSCTFTCGIL